MRFFAFLFVFSFALPAWPQDAVPSPAPNAQFVIHWNSAKVPWDDWFKSNAMITDKGDYVHFFWNAQDFRLNFEAKDKKRRLADAALQLISRLYPADAKADLMKVDIVYVLERDSYGMPRWESLQRVAHLEFSRSAVLVNGKPKASLTAGEFKKIFNPFELF